MLTKAASGLRLKTLVPSQSCQMQNEEPLFLMVACVFQGVHPIPLHEKPAEAHMHDLGNPV